ncbi:MAG: hypothetical protein ACE5J5_00640 [Candidatus Hydrothermarchaeales archaeon]
MSIYSIFIISLLLSVAYNFYEIKKGSYHRFPFWVNIILVALFLTLFFWFWMTAFKRMKIKNVKVGKEVMFF